MKSPCNNQRDFAKKSRRPACTDRAAARHLNFTLGVVIVLGACFNHSPASAQQSTATSAIYGRGVHAYFAGNTSQAEEYFTQAIQSGSSDPRPYYFRAMLRLGMGRQFEAENDMRVGAIFEARNPGVQHSIGRALQRVQGTNRRTLEKFRRQARLDRLQQGQQQSQQRYEQLDRRSPKVLNRAVPLPLAQPVQPPQQPALPSAAPAVVAPGPLAPSPPIEAPVLSSPQPLQPAAAQPIPAGSGTKAEDDLFGAPAPVTPTDDPFDSSPTTAPAPQPAPAPVEADPFDELPFPTPQPEATDGDLFGGTAEAAPAGEAPAPETEMAEDDPFGADVPAEVPAGPAEVPAGPAEVPAEDESEAPATEPDDSDPFGDSAADEAMESEAEASEEDSDPFGEATESAEEEDPFGDSSESAEDEPAESDDPFGDEAMEEESKPAEESSESADEAPDEAPAEEEEPAPEADEDDPFGDFGAVTPLPAGEVFAQASLTNASGSAMKDPAGQLFFALGQWIGSRGGPASASDSKVASVARPEVIQADFELGPADEVRELPATAELPSDDDPFAEAAPAETATDEDDPFSDF